MLFLENVKRVNGLVDQVTTKLAFLAPLATRIVIGLAFYHTGVGKIRHFPNIVQFFDSLGIPFPTFNAGLVSGMEAVGGIMLILGLFTRFFASGLAVTMVVALMTADSATFLASWSSASENSPTDVAAFVFLLFLGWLVFYGAGKLSLDAVLRKVLKTEPESLEA